jgi:hypothetical protein
MNKKLVVFALIASVLLALASPVFVSSQNELTVTNSAAKADFPNKITFTAAVNSNVNITDIRLRYIIDQVTFTRVTSESFVDFTPEKKVDASWSLELLQIGGRPPGTNISYWWVAKDASGRRLETPPQQIQLNDNRYSWHTLTDGKITMHWYEGNDAFAQELMSAAQQALRLLKDSTGAALERQVNLYIYGSTQDLLGALVNPAEWTGGVSFSTFSTIAIGIAPSNLAWGKRAVNHELSHQVIHQVTSNPYAGQPVWLDEGLAVYAEGPADPTYVAMVKSAAAAGTLISVRSLASPFSAKSDQANLSYAESFSIVDYLISQYGQAKMLSLLNTFRQGSTYDNAMKAAYGFDMDGLNRLWQDYLNRQTAARLTDSLLAAALQMTPSYD